MPSQPAEQEMVHAGIDQSLAGLDLISLILGEAAQSATPGDGIINSAIPKFEGEPISRPFKTELKRLPRE
jgi:hypothetical protein